MDAQYPRLQLVGARDRAIQTTGKIFSDMTMNGTGTLYFANLSQAFAVTTSSPGLADSAWPMYQQNPQHTGSVMPLAIASPRLDFAMVSDSTGNLTLHVQPGGTYQLQYSSALTNWTNDGPPFLAGSNATTRPVTIDGGARFWRLVTNP